MQRIIALISLIVMSASTALCIAGFRSDLMLDIATVLFAVLMVKKGLESRNLGGIFNLSRQKISFRRKNAIIEFVLAVEFVLVGIAEGIILAEYGVLSAAVLGTLTTIGLILLLAIVFYRIFFLNMFNEDVIDSEKFRKTFSWKNRAPEGRSGHANGQGTLPITPIVRL